MLRGDIDECFDTAVELVKTTGKIVMEGFGSVNATSEKSNAADLVTVYDTRVEDFLFGGLKEKFPSHKFIGEETSYVDGSEPTLTDSPTWIIDPIDGTINFVHHLPHVAISVALAVSKKTVIGIVYNPVMDQLYTAVASKGAFLNFQPIRVSNTRDMSKALVNISRTEPNKLNSSRSVIDYGIIKHIRGLTHGNVSLGSCSVEMCYVAAGSINAFYVDNWRIKCWDVAAAALIIQEAGGVVVDTTGGPFDLMTARVFCAGTQELATSVLKEVNNYLQSSSSA